MTRYLLGRLAQALLVLAAASALTFGAVFLSGDPALSMAGEGATQEDVDSLRRRLGLDRPPHEQYFTFVSRSLRGDLGTSLRHGQPVFDLVTERLPATLELAVAATLLAVLIGIPVGVVSAVWRGSSVDLAAMGSALLAQSIPSFLLGLILMLVAGVSFRLLPISGRGGLDHLLLPAVTLSAYFVARNARMVRSSLLEVLGQEYLVTARAKGLAEWTVVTRHALRNALIPVVTLVGLDLGTLLSGSVVIETLFAWPGVGRLTVQAIFVKDFPLVQGAVLVFAAGFVLLNLATDVLYAYLNPRVRYG